MMKMEDQTRFRRVFRYYRYIEADAFARYLHEMSLKGWHLKGWKLWLEFEKGESRDIQYAVEVFPQGSEMDVKPGKDAEEYAEYCRAAGWEFVNSRRRFCIFRKTAEDALPIMTEEERFKNIRKAEWKRCLMTVLTGVFILGMPAVQLSRVDVVLMLFSNMLLLPGLILAVLFACEILQCIVLAVWCIKAGRRVRAGERPSYEKSWGKYVWYAMAALILIALTEECCGVDIMEKVQRISKGRVKVGPGTLYAVLSKFEDNGILRRTAEEGRRKSYIITERGRQR